MIERYLLLITKSMSKLTKGAMPELSKVVMDVKLTLPYAIQYGEGFFH